MHIKKKFIFYKILNKLDILYILSKLDNYTHNILLYLSKLHYIYTYIHKYMYNIYINIHIRYIE